MGTIPRTESRTGGSRARAIVFAACLILVAETGRAQQKDNKPGVVDLTSQNLSQVAATPAEIKAILTKDSGIMVELKRWVAKDAADHGQVLDETDLTNYAIFDRLDSDIQFRSLATALVQRYGYLRPQINPNSDVGREQELLRIERAKWLAQEQEEQRAQARQMATFNMQRAASGQCDVQRDPNCTSALPGTIPAQLPGGGQQLPLPPSVLPDLNIPNLPVGGAALQRAQLMQGGDNSSLMQMSPLPLATSFGGGATPNAFNIGAFGATGGSSGDSDIGKQFASAFGGGNNNNSGSGTGSQDSILAALGTGIDGTGGGMMANSIPYDNPSADLKSSPLTPGQPIGQGNPRGEAGGRVDMVRRWTPYQNIPSLYDMYVQSVARPATPQRFGSEVFANGTRDSQLIPMDVPAGPDYVVGPGDGLSIDLWGGLSTRLVRTVDREGRVSLPEVGPILVSGKTLAEVQEDLQRVLRTQFRDISAGVSLSRLRTIRVYEVGDVKNAGAYDISSLSTPLNALFVAGGPTERGSMRIINHYRGNQLIQVVDVYDLLLHGVKGDIKTLENGDTVQVPTIGPQVTIEGMVRRPAIYEMHDEKTLASVIDLAGGLLPAATLRQVEVQRIVAHDKQTMANLDILETDGPSEIAKKLEGFQVQDGDRIRIFPIATYNQDAVYVEGHVARPGRYSFHEGMRVTDVISSYKDMLPEPSTDYAEIIRLNAPDFRPTVESFNLATAFKNPSEAPILHAMDTVRIFSRYDFENPPTVSVMGTVRLPGTYLTTGEIHLADAVHLAGGLGPDAEMTDAQVFRYLPDGQFKIFSVNLSQALNGNAVENIVLQPRDRLLIHLNPEASEPATVSVQGEVAKPGRYSLTTNMHVADLIHIGGGLKPSADPTLADLTTYDVLNETKIAAQHQEISISAALSGDANANLPLHNGDVVTIRQIAGWGDLGASIAVKGEIKHPGTYGIRPGEKLSSILERAGGMGTDAYPYGAVLERAQVRDLQAKEQQSMILRVQAIRSKLEMLPDGDQKQREAKESAIGQYESTLEELSANPPVGRVSIRISSDIKRWKNSSADIEVRAGDVLVVPKKPSYVMISGQVLNPTAVSYRPGRSANWYLSQGGGASALGDKRAIFVIRADGSVVGTKKSMWEGESLGAVLQPGDTVVVPERAVSVGGTQWQTLFSGAQVAASVSSAIALVLYYK